MTGAAPEERGEQTQPMAVPPWSKVAGGWPGSRTERGPYADADTIDELDAVVTTEAGAAPRGGAPAETAAAGAAPPGAEAGEGPSGSGGVPSGSGGPPSGSGGGPRTPQVGADWPDAARPPGSGSVLAWLWGEQGQAGEYLLTSHSMTIGRDRGNDIVLSDATVGLEHAKIEYCEGQWWLQPADPAGPTWVNGQPVEPGQRRRVTDGDRLRFGFHTQFRLLVPGAR